MTKPGYLHIASPPLYRTGLIVNGYRFQHAAGDGSTPPISLNRPPAFATAESQARTWFTQGRVVAPDQPLSMEPASGSLRFVLKWEEEATALRRLLGAAQPVRMVVGDWVEDLWSLAAAESTRTEWRTSRPMPYDQPVPIGNATWFSPTDYAPLAALLDSDLQPTPQTVITTGTPGAGEVLVPVTGGGLSTTVETPAASTLTGAYLAVTYPALYRVRAVVSYELRVANGLDVGVDFEELPAGTYGVAA